MACTPTYTAEPIDYDPVSCGAACRGCVASVSDVSASGGASSCEFTWTVVRSGCQSQPDKTFSGSKTVACGATHVEEFPCDAGSCHFYRLTLICASGTPPGPG